MDTMQKAMGDNYTVSCDVGVTGTDISPFGGSYLITKKWIDPTIFKANPNLFVNTMSYHTPKSCSIQQWVHDANEMEHSWGLSRKQINLGIGYRLSDALLDVQKSSKGFFALCGFAHPQKEKMRKMCNCLSS